MVTARVKASDRTKACQQVVTVLKKQYGKAPSYDHNVLDTLLFAICLENSRFDEAEQGLDTLQKSFFDYNEARVSSITELQAILSDLSQPDWKALRVRDSLQSIFEDRYSYEIEDLKKKGLDAAEKYLRGITSLSDYVIHHTLLEAVGAHVFPVDENTFKAALWLGLLEPGTEYDQASDQFKSSIRKADVPLAYYLLKSLANDPEYQPYFDEENPELGENALENLQHSSKYLKDLLAGKAAAPKPKTKASSSSGGSKSASKSASSGEAKKKSKTAKAKTDDTDSEPKAAKATKKTAKKSTKKTAAKKSSKSSKK